MDSKNEPNTETPPIHERNWAKLVTWFFGIVTGILTVVTAYFSIRSGLKETTFGACQLAPSSPVEIERLNDYIHQGETSAGQREYSQAAKMFEQVIQLEPHYLGAHQNLGVVLMNQNKVQDAIRSFRQEATLIDCLKSVPYEELHRFAYFLNNDVTADGSKNAALKERLDTAEDTVNYNLACALAKEGETQNALDELKKAAANQSIRRSIVNGDRDLDSVRNTPGFQSALNQFPQ